MKEILINKNDAGQRLDSFLRKMMPSAPQSLVYKYIRTNKIKLNGKKKQGDTRLCEGDIIKYFGDETLLLKPAFVPCKYDLTIVYEDDNIIAVNKPAGLLCQTDKNHHGNTLSEYIKSYFYEKGIFDPEKENSFSPALSNRLDTNTEGLVLAAKNAESQRILNQKLKNREIRRFYACKVDKLPQNQSGIITKKLLKDTKNNITKTSDKGINAETHYKIADREKHILEIEIITGRSHQIRAHLQSIGCPISGDAKYGSKGSGQKLISYRTVFEFKSPAGILDYLNNKEIVIPYNFD